MTNNEMGERMARLEAKMENVEKKLDALAEVIQNFPDQLDQRYASKVVEKVVYGAVGVMLTALLLSIVYLTMQSSP